VKKKEGPVESFLESHYYFKGEGDPEKRTTEGGREKERGVSGFDKCGTCQKEDLRERLIRGKRGEKKLLKSSYKLKRSEAHHRGVEGYIYPRERLLVGGEGKDLMGGYTENSQGYFIHLHLN